MTSPSTRVVGRKEQAMRKRCGECGRVFDLLDETDVAEWAYGHDCEGRPVTLAGDDWCLGSRDSAQAKIENLFK
jgi:hypothetical protein